MEKVLDSLKAIATDIFEGTNSEGNKVFRVEVDLNEVRKIEFFKDLKITGVFQDPYKDFCVGSDLAIGQFGLYLKSPIISLHYTFK